MICNLLSNAIRYTDRGRILLGCRARAGDNVQIEVWDSGVGITEEQLPHIFQEYYQGDRRYAPGRLWLGPCDREAVGRNPGSTGSEVRSIPGEGTRFFIEVPRGRSGVKVSEAAPPVHLHNGAFPGQRSRDRGRGVRALGASGRTFQRDRGGGDHCCNDHDSFELWSTRAGPAPGCARCVTSNLRGSHRMVSRPSGICVRPLAGTCRPS